MPVLRLFIHLPQIMAATALFCLMVMTFADVVLRSVFNAPIEVSADMTRVLMAITVFSVLPVMSAKGAHISVDLLESTIKRFNLMRLSDVLVSLFCGAILILPAKRVFDLAERSRSYGDVMEYLGIPLFYIGWFISVMTAITALALIFRGVVLIFRPSMSEILK